MAYIKRMPSGDVGGTFGDAGFIGGGDTPTTAGNAQSWYNIQDFLGANQGDTTGQRIAGSALNKEVEAGKSSLQNQVSGLSALQNPIAAPSQPIPTPEGQAQIALYNPDPNTLGGLLGTDNYDAIRAGVNQSYQAPTGSEFTPITSSVDKIQPNQFNTIADFIGLGQKKSSTYTPGMQKMDELLMRGDKDFTQNFAQQAKDRYASEVTNPYQAAVANREQERTKNKSDIESASSGWKSQVQDWTGQANRNIEDVLSKQQQNYNTIQPTYNKIISDIMGGIGRNEENMESRIRDAANIQNLLSVQPSRETAINDLGGTALTQDYNALQDILGGTPSYLSTSPQNYKSYTEQEIRDYIQNALVNAGILNN